VFRGSTYDRLCALIVRAERELSSQEDRELLRQMRSLRRDFETPPVNFDMSVLETRYRYLNNDWSSDKKRRTRAAQHHQADRKAEADAVKIARFVAERNDPAAIAARKARKQRDIAAMEAELEARTTKAMQEREAFHAAQAKAKEAAAKAAKAAGEARRKRRADDERGAIKLNKIVAMLEKQQEMKIQRERKLKGELNK
jgi:hypothetical protein